mgnify:CR=1 FL=1
MESRNRTAIINRLKRIEGQARGLIRMVEADRYCIDILQQMQAVKAALAKVESEILKAHAGSCVEEALQSGTLAEQRKKFSELVDLLERIKS